MSLKSKKLNDSNNSAIKTKPTIFPLGFSVSLVEDGSVIIDFVDTLNERATIIESIALSREKALTLSGALMGAIENEESED